MAVTEKELLEMRKRLVSGNGMVEKVYPEGRYLELQLAILNDPQYAGMGLLPAPQGADFQIADPERSVQETRRLKRKGLRKPRRVIVGYVGGSVWYTNCPVKELDQPKAKSPVRRPKKAVEAELTLEEV